LKKKFPIIFHQVSSFSKISPMKDLLTLSEVSTFLKVPKSTIYKLARERRLPGHKVGKHWRFVREEIEAWVQNAGSDEAMVGATSGNGSSDRFSLN
jgi:excisionase family DNA binding protein